MNRQEIYHEMTDSKRHSTIVSYDMMKNKYMKYLEGIYLKNTIRILEIKQIAESVKCVLDCRKVDEGKV